VPTYAEAGHARLLFAPAEKAIAIAAKRVHAASRAEPKGGLGAKGTKSYVAGLTPEDTQHPSVAILMRDHS
jgi:hypothetical protein